MNKNIDYKYYKTSDLYLASFLFCKGMEIAGIDISEGRMRARFSFIDSPEREEMVNDFLYGKDGTVMVDARTIMMAQKQLKDKLYAL